VVARSRNVYSPFSILTDTISLDEGVFLGHLIVAGNNKTYLGLHVKCLLYLPNFAKIWNFSQILMKVPNTKFHGNPSSGGHTDTDRRMDGHDEANRCFY